MQLELTWRAGVSISALHAAGAMLSGKQLVDPALQAALESALPSLMAALNPLGPQQPLLLEHLTALSAEIENNQQLAELALVKTLGREQTSPSMTATLAAAIAALEAALLRARPGLVDELLVRGGPLRELWDARGPGLWRLLGQFTERELLVERADVLLVQPALGGGGAAHWRSNSVRIEAVLTNPHAQLPEVVRLAWLLAQLQLDLPRYSESVPRDRWRRAAPLAMIPPVLAAAEEVELARADLETTAFALASWTEMMHQEASDVQRNAGILQNWWEMYCASRPPFAVALAALAEMLDEADVAAD